MLANSEKNIIVQIYDQCINDSNWASLIKSMTNYFKCDAGLFVLVDVLQVELLFTHQYGFKLFSDHHSTKWNLELLKLCKHVCSKGNGHLSQNFFISHQDFLLYLENHPILHSSFFEYLNSMIVLFKIEQHRYALFGLYSKQENFTFDIVQKYKFENFILHIKKSMQIQQKLLINKVKLHQVLNMFSYLHSALLIIDKNKKVIYTSDKAKQIIDKSSSIRILANQELKVTRKHRAQFDHFFKNCYPLDDLYMNDIHHHFLKIKNTDDAEIYVQLIPMSASSETGIFGLKSDYIFLLLHDEHISRQLPKTYLKMSFQLSNREIEICQLFVNGLNLQEIAKHCHLTLSTVRTYMKHIYTKTNCSSQAQLMSVLKEVGSMDYADTNF